jgi:hypothetical protein
MGLGSAHFARIQGVLEFLKYVPVLFSVALRRIIE